MCSCALCEMPQNSLIPPASPALTRLNLPSVCAHTHCCAPFSTTQHGCPSDFLPALSMCWYKLSHKCVPLCSLWCTCHCAPSGAHATMCHQVPTHACASVCLLMTCHHMHLLPPHAPAATSQCLPTCSCAPANTQHPVSTPDTLDPQSSPFLAQGPESNMLMECGWTNRHGATSSS